MMKVAIMIPMTDKTARPHVTETLRPAGWSANVERMEWPETNHEGIPRFPAQIAAEAQAHVEMACDRCYPALVIITRCSMVALRVRRMVAEGAPIEVTIHFPGSAHPPATIAADGEVDTWPEGLFSEDFEEARAIRRARQSKKAARR